MNYWENGMSWPTENLAATSFNMYSRSGAMATAARRTLACRMPCWVSTAADIAKVDRELWASRQNLMSMIMLGIARIYDLGASELSSLQRQMRSLKENLAARGIDVSTSGIVSAPDAATPEEIAGASRAVDALTRQVYVLDHRVGSEIDALTHSVRKSQRGILDVDEMNAVRLNALEDVTWNGRLRAGILGANLVKRQALLTSLRRGELPRGIYQPLIDGVAPSLTERLAFTAYTAANSPFWDALLKNWGTPNQRHVTGPYMHALWGNFFADGKPLTPKLLLANGRAAAEKPTLENLPELIDEMEAVYEEMKDEEQARIQVSVTVGADGEPRFTAIIPGTAVPINEYHGWNKHPKGLDWPANAKAKGFGDSAVTQSIAGAVELAVRQYEIDTGRTLTSPPKLLLAGHSQGGIVAANLAADPSFSARFNIEHVLAVGSPVEDIEVPSHTKVTTLVNQDDPVPRLDGDLKEITSVLHPLSPPGTGQAVDAIRPSWTPPDNYEEIRFLNKDHRETNATLLEKLNPFDDHAVKLYAQRAERSLTLNRDSMLGVLERDISEYLNNADDSTRIFYTSQVGRR